MTSARTVTLIGADGTRHVLACSDEPYQLSMRAQLHGTAPYALGTRRVGLIPGERLDTVQALPRTLVVPLRVEGLTELAVDQAMGALGSVLSPRADVRILYRRPDGVERELTARYAGGGDAVSAFDEAGYLQHWCTVPLVFKALWPYWRDPAASTATHGPETFNDGRAAGSNLVTVTNAGDVEVWPEITVTGYAEGIEAMSLTTGQVWRCRRILTVADELRIDTDPRSFGVYVNGAADYTVMDSLSEFWPLEPGANVLLFRANTATGAEPIGAFQVRWRPQWETP